MRNKCLGLKGCLEYQTDTWVTYIIKQSNKHRRLHLSPPPLTALFMDHNHRARLSLTSLLPRLLLSLIQHPLFWILISFQSQNSAPKPPVHLASLWNHQVSVATFSGYRCSHFGRQQSAGTPHQTGRKPPGRQGHWAGSSAEKRLKTYWP